MSMKFPLLILMRFKIYERDKLSSLNMDLDNKKDINR